MTPRQAAERLNLSPQQVRWLIRHRYLVADRLETPDWGPGFVYDVTEAHINQYLSVPRDGRGHPVKAVSR